MTTGNQVVPTSTALQARVMIYQPSQRPRERSGQWIDTGFGRCRVTGRLGQRHADIVESMLYVAERRREISDGGIELLIDPAKLRRMLSDHQYSHDRIKKLLTDLRAATVEIVTPEMESTGDSIIGGLIDHVRPSPMTRRDPLTGGERHLWRVRLGVALVMLLERDLSLYYPPAPIARLQHGISQALARHVLTHRHDPAGGWHLDTLIRAVGGEAVNSMMLRNYRRRLKDDTAGLIEIGIEIDATDRVKRVTAAR
ncbi:TPA: ABC transporter ATPase [Pseudomonas aeruginosa]|nr:ABC transporter ATPase [Pseudomonas aeruginosa]HEQ1694942.1 ABC transporter ATPase [Pseudomonas aeruginosa]HEQ1730680.1 ABC transporter ATPase [Pseudomonas aeruginosa]HEQ1737173.1 ABC transporter ATPase [Pseudomonas aeruginosa]HEQ1789918.1 ABC transporter ATPase [Pseudomonas aeruginosa]